MSPAPVAQSSFRSPRRYRTLRFRLTGKKPDRIQGWRERPVLVSLPPVVGVTPSDKPPVRIFVGTEPEQYRAERVLVFSILKHRDPARAYEIHLMKDLTGFDRNNWWTGFTSYRYAIPDLAGRAGRAIYNDVDQIYFADPAELFDLDMKGAAALAISDEESSVMLIDCERLASVWHEDEAHRVHSSVHFQKLAAGAGLWGSMAGDWNARDFEFTPGQSRLLHYTTLYKQPWHPFPELFKYQHNTEGHFWHALEAEADAAGYTIFSAATPSPDFLALRQRGGPSPARPPAPAVQARIRRLAGGGSVAIPATFDAIAPADVVAAVDLLERYPEDDIPWVLAALFKAARKSLFISVNCRGIANLAAADSAHLTHQSAKWWQSQIETAARMAPGVKWTLALARDNGGAFPMLRRERVISRV
ncbi:hypothetical protein [Zavarzinia sp.]|uniref:hypothetical protein n=1 Tax=Zavarzinia sp. TaxID=2027920 RepID=UPI003BB54620